MGRQRIQLDERFWRRVEPTTITACWEWRGRRTRAGYGCIRESPDSHKYLRAHRLSWVIHNGPIPDGLCVLHRCDNPPCVNPNHLFLGTNKDNTRDMMAKGRARFGNPRGRPKLSVDQVRNIKKHLQLEVLTVKELACFYGLTVGAIYHIAEGVTWREV